MIDLVYRVLYVLMMYVSVCECIGVLSVILSTMLICIADPIAMR